MDYRTPYSHKSNHRVEQMLVPERVRKERECPEVATLAEAIIEQAVWDWRAIENKMIMPISGCNKGELSNFFNSVWLDSLLSVVGNITADAIRSELGVESIESFE